MSREEMLQSDWYCNFLCSEWVTVFIVNVILVRWVEPGGQDYFRYGHYSSYSGHI